MTNKRTNFKKGIRLKPTDDALESEGDISVSVTTPKLKAKVDGVDRDIVTEDQDQTLTTKTINSASNTITIDADTATVSNIEVDNLKAGVLDIDLNAVSASDDTIPSAKATKAYVDAQVATKDDAVEISFDNTASGLTAANVQAAVDEVEDRLDTAETTIGTNTTATSDHIADAADAHDASAISNVASGNLVATDVQSALNELQTELDSTSTAAGAAQTTADDHIADTIAAHDASAISSVASGNLVATDVQGALNELQTELDGKAVSSEITDHTGDTVDAHDASAVSSIPSGNLAATEVQAALNELQTDVDTRATDSDLTTHTGATAAHGVSGAIVGTTDTQTLTNKSIQSPSRLDPKKDTLANLTTYASTAVNGEIVYATDTDQMFRVLDAALSPIGGGGGGLDVFETETFENLDAAGLLQTGKDPIFSGAAAVLGGVVADEITNPISGDRSIKYTAGAASQNDYVSIKAVDLSLKQRGQQVKEIIWADMTNFSTEVELVAYDVTNSKKLNIDADTLKAGQSLAKYEMIFDIPQTCTSIEYGIHMIVTPVNTDVLIIDEVEITNDVFSKANLITTQSYRIQQATNAMSDLTDGVQFNLGTLTPVENGSGLFVVENSGTLTRVRALTDIDIVITGYGPCALTLAQHVSIIDSDTSAILINGSGVDASGRMATVSGPLHLTAGDNVSFAASSTLVSSASLAGLSVSASAAAVHVITPAKSNLTDWEDFTPTASTGWGTITSGKGTMRRVGDSLEVVASFTSGTVIAADNFIYLPPGLNIDTAKVGIAQKNILGTAAVALTASGQIFGSTAGATYFASYNGANTDRMYLVTRTSSSATWNYTQTVSSLVGSGAKVLVRYTVPIEGWSSDVSFLAAIPQEQTMYIDVGPVGEYMDVDTSSTTYRAATLTALSGDIFGSINSNQLTLPAGTYDYSLPVGGRSLNSDFITFNLENITDTLDIDTFIKVVYNGTVDRTTAVVHSSFTVTSEKAIEFQTKSSGTNGQQLVGRIKITKRR